MNHLQSSFERSMTRVLLVFADAAKAQRAPSCHFRLDSSMGQPSLLTDANQLLMTTVDSIWRAGWSHLVVDALVPFLCVVSS